MVELKDKFVYYKFRQLSEVIGLFVKKRDINKPIIEIPELGVSWIRAPAYKELDIDITSMPSLSLVLRIDCEKKWLVSKIKYSI